MNANETITVASGDQKMEVCPLSAIEKLRIFKILPVGCDEKLLYLSMVLTAASVRSIDGTPVPFPRNEAGFELIIGRLGDNGLEEIQKALAPAEQDVPSLEDMAGK
jgi:hypothetical protein